MSIQLIDNNEKFDKIKTNLRSDKNLKPINKNIYKKLLSVFKPDKQNNILWIGPAKDKIYDYIKKLDLSPASKRIYYETLAHILLMINKTKYKEYSKMLFLEGLNIQTKINKHNDKQEATEAETNKLIRFNDLVKLRQLYLTEFNKDESNIKNNMISLILSLNTLLPPLRLDWLKMKLYKGKDEPKNKKHNYLWLNNDKYKIIINTDKMSNKKGGSILDITDINNDYIKGHEITKILNESFKALKRTYVLVQLTDKKLNMEPSTYNYLLEEATRRQITNNILRKSYINYYYNEFKPKLNLEAKKQISTYMRNTTGTAEQNYIKLTKVKPLKISELKPESKTEFNIKTWSKEYYENNKDEIKNKRKERHDKNKLSENKQKIIRNLNNGTTKNPTKTTIKKYNLVKIGDKWR